MDALKKLLQMKDLTEDESALALEYIMQGNANNSQIAAFLTALRIKGETVDEIVGLVKTMRKYSKKVTLTKKPETGNLLDTAGTGGDGSKTFNISTAAAFVAAGAGAVLAKHGNRAASSKSGSADVLEELGVDIDINEEIAKKQLEKMGITFLFAKSYHPAMRFVAPVRKELGFRTIFNVLGPLTNPADAKRQVIGVYDKGIMKKMAEALAKLGTEKTVFLSSDIDEFSISTETSVIEVAGKEIKEYILAPEDFGIERGKIGELQVVDRIESAGVIINVLEGKPGAARDVVVLNAGAAIYACGLAGTIKEGTKLAEKSIDSGKALEKLDALRNFVVE